MDGDSAAGGGRQRPYDSAPLTSGSSLDAEAAGLVGLSEATFTESAREDAARKHINPSDASLLTLSSPGISSAAANTTSSSGVKTEQPSGSSANNGQQNSSSGDNGSVAAAVDALSSEAFVAAVAGLSGSLDHSGGGTGQPAQGAQGNQAADTAAPSVSISNIESSVAASPASLLTRQPSLGSSPTIGSPAVHPVDSIHSAFNVGLSRFTHARSPTLRTPPPPELPPSPLLAPDSNSPSPILESRQKNSAGETAAGPHENVSPLSVPVAGRPPRSAELPRPSQGSWVHPLPDRPGHQRRSRDGSPGQVSETSLGFASAQRALLADVEAAREALKQEEADIEQPISHSLAKPSVAAAPPASPPMQAEASPEGQDAAADVISVSEADPPMIAGIDHQTQGVGAGSRDEEPHGRPATVPQETSSADQQPEEALRSSGPESQVDSNTMAVPGLADSGTLNDFLSDLKVKYRLSGSRSRSSSRSKSSRESGEASVRPSPAPAAPDSTLGRVIPRADNSSSAVTKPEEHTEITLAPGSPQPIMSAAPVVVATASPMLAQKGQQEAVDGREHHGSLSVRQGVPPEQPAVDWSDINRALRSLSLPPIQSARPSALELRELMGSLVRELERKHWMASKAGDALQEARLKEENLMADIARLGEEAKVARRCASEMANSSGSEAQKDKAATLKAEARVKQAESEANRLRQRMAQVEHGSRAKEKAIDKLRSTYSEFVTREERRDERHKEVYARLKRAAALAKAGRSGASAASRAVRELRPLEVAGMYEDQLLAMEEETAALKGELSSMAKQLRDAENVVAEARRGGWRPQQQKPSSEVDKQQIYSLETRLAETQAELKALAERSADASRAAARREAELEARCDRLAEDSGGLILELENRPSLQDLRAAKRQVDMLQRKIGELRANRGEGDNNGPRGAMQVVHAAEPLTSKARMRRDKQIHRLELTEVEHLPRDVLVTVLQDSCIAVEQSDATQLPMAIAKLKRIVVAVPKMEAVLSNCCDSVYRKGCAFLPDGLPGQGPQQVSIVLDHWVKLLHRLAELEELRESVLSHLSMRVGSRKPPQSSGEIIYSVKALVERERASLTASDTIAAAEETMQDPQGLLQKILGRYQQLFDCPKLDSAMASMNQLYMSLEEARNFRKNLAAMLGLETSASPALCIASVQKLLDHHRRTLDLRADYVHRLEADQLKHRAHMQQALRRARRPDPDDGPVGITPHVHAPARSPSEASEPVVASGMQ